MSALLQLGLTTDLQRSPARKGPRSPVRKGPRSPVRKERRSRVRKERRSLVRKEQRSLARKEQRSLVRKEQRSLARRDPSWLAVVVRARSSKACGSSRTSKAAGIFPVSQRDPTKQKLMTRRKRP